MSVMSLAGQFIVDVSGAGDFDFSATDDVMVSMLLISMMFWLAFCYLLRQI